MIPEDQILFTISDSNIAVSADLIPFGGSVLKCNMDDLIGKFLVVILKGKILSPICFLIDLSELDLV